MKDLCVLIPAKDEALVIARTIESVLRAGILPQDIHVIDDGSSDATGAIARRYGVWVMRNPTNIGKAKSIARAFQYFQLVWKYGYIALMDADTQVDLHYYEEVRASFLANPNAAAVCGYAQSISHNWLTAYRAFMYFIMDLVYKRGQHIMGVISVAPGCASTYRAAIFPKLVWTSDTVVEDMDVTIQIHRMHLGPIVYAPRAIVYTQDPRTLRDYVKQMWRWHSGAWQIIKKYRMFTGRTKLDYECKLMMGEGLVVSAFLALIPVWLIGAFRITLGILCLDYLLVFVLSLWAAIGSKRKDVFIYSPLYVIPHLVDCAVFLYAFWSVIVRRKTVSGWSFVGRYAEPVKEVP